MSICFQYQCMQKWISYRSRYQYTTTRSPVPMDAKWRGYSYLQCSNACIGALEVAYACKMKRIQLPMSKHAKKTPTDNPQQSAHLHCIRFQPLQNCLNSGQIWKQMKNISHLNSWMDCQKKVKYICHHKNVPVFLMDSKSPTCTLWKPFLPRWNPAFCKPREPEICK